MARRIAAMIGLMAVIVLALTLLYRVYLHHANAAPYVDRGDGAIVALDARRA